MNHEEAIRGQAAAAYLLGDMPAAEREAFEEHYFDCRECGDAVRAGATMLATGRSVVEKESSFRRFRPLKSALTGAAAAALVVIGTYQTAVIPRLQSLARPPMMEVLRPTQLMTTEMRGEPAEEQTIRFEDDKPFVLYREVPADAPPFPRYQAEFRTMSGKVLECVAVPADIARSDDSIPLSVRPLPAGRYQLAIVGVQKDGNRSDIVSGIVVVQ